MKTIHEPFGEQNIAADKGVNYALRSSRVRGKRILT